MSTAHFPAEIVVRACHRFTGLYYVAVAEPLDDAVVVEFRPRDLSRQAIDVAGEFNNELLDQRMRAELEHETRAIRELIVAQAFAEADLPASRSTDPGASDDPAR